MYQEQFNLSSKDILEKEFKIDTRGYRLKEVDQYLDLIISDYEQFFKILKEKDQEKEELLDEIMSLKQENRNLKTSLEIAKSSDNDEMSSTKSISNVDIMKRLSQLEKIVYGKDE
ncbi:MAG: DivIVA domain-containing protein [Bacilli bacterium]|nr:DivIVA domain-containing protein [Bacilli bacterium]